MTNSATRRFLDLTGLEPGDIILTSSRTFTSRCIIFAQRIWHFSFLHPAFSHAILVISPLVTFDTIGGMGARFRRQIPDEISEDEHGEIKLWLDVSTYKNVAVMRYGSQVDPYALLLAASVENTAAYPGPIAFFSLFHPKIKSLWNRLKGRKEVAKAVPHGMFCSSLAAHLLLKVGVERHLPNGDWSAISPFKLYIQSCEMPALLVEKTLNGFSHNEIHQAMLGHARAQAGENAFIDLNRFQHMSEDLMKRVADSSLIGASLAQDPMYFIEIFGQRISLIEYPHLAHMPDMLRVIEGSGAMLDEFKARKDCFRKCKQSCPIAGMCSEMMDIQYAKIFAERGLSCD